MDARVRSAIDIPPFARALLREVGPEMAEGTYPLTKEVESSFIATSPDLDAP